MSDPAESQQIHVRGVFRQFFSVIAVLVIFRLLFLFGTAQCHRSPILWKRLPWAALLGVTGGWVFGLAVPSPDSPALSVLVGLSCFALSLVGIVAVEHRLRGRVPEAIASYVLALRGHFQNPAVTLAVVRGGLAGMILAALQTELAYLTAFGLPSRAAWVFGAFLDPKPAGYAMTSFSPALFTLASSIFHGLWLGPVLLGLGRIDARGSKREKPFSIGIYAFIVAAGWPSHIGTFEGIFIGFFLCSAIWAVALGLFAWKYDLLTAVFAVATATLFSLYWPLLHMLREIGNEGQWALFAGWALVLVLAAVAAFRAPLRQYLAQR